jgi:succinate dehydrogenase / fumarate reductase cytochrome b subunit
MSSTFYSSLTKKYVMSLAGLFLISFLLVHLSINLLILFDDSRLLFNEAAHFMGTNPLIQTFQWVLFAGFAIHIIFGFILQIQNWMARPVRYKKRSISEESLLSKFMFHTGVVIGVFLVIHLVDFFAKKMGGTVPMFEGGPYEMEDMGLLIVEKFSSGGYVAFYVVALLFLGFHLDHAFQSAWQSIGLNNYKYMAFLKGVSRLLAIVITVGFISIPLVIYFK